VCHIDAEDILHLLFKCEAARSLWEDLGLSSLITEALVTDLSGSAVLKHILRLPGSMPSGFSVVKLKELVAVTCWYLWWIRDTSQTYL
jgi:hypothetical protein